MVEHDGPFTTWPDPFIGSNTTKTSHWVNTQRKGAILTSIEQYVVLNVVWGHGPKHFGSL